MKKALVLFALVSFCSMSISAQVFRVGLGGVGIGGGKNAARATLHAVDVSYAPNPKMDFGGYIGTSLGLNSKSSTASGGVRYGVQSKYYLKTGKFKPFVGLQLGLNTGAKVKVDATSANVVDGGTKLQLAPQAGFRVGPLNIWAAYQSGFMINGGLVFGFGNFKE